MKTAVELQLLAKNAKLKYKTNLITRSVIEKADKTLLSAASRGFREANINIGVTSIEGLLLGVPNIDTSEEVIDYDIIKTYFSNLNFVVSFKNVDDKEEITLVIVLKVTYGLYTYIR